MPTKNEKKAPLRREDRPGHLDPDYADSLRERHEKEPGEPRAYVRRARIADDLAEELAEQAVVSMTTGEDSLLEDFEQEVPEETGGPFVHTTGKEEFARGKDPSNPKGAKREPFPTT